MGSLYHFVIYLQYFKLYSLLLYTCCQSPYSIAFIDSDSTSWLVVNTLIDTFFFIDIFVNFTSAYYDLDYELIDDRKVIAKTYLSSWFSVDFLSIIPFD